MDFSLNEDQESVRDLARKILEDLATNERLRELEAADEGFDRKLWEELAGAHLLGVAVDEAHGGSGMGFFTLCLLLEEVGRAVAPVPVLPSLALGALPLARFGSEEQKHRWLPGVASGEITLSAGLLEADGDDPTRPGLEARRDGDAWTLHGAKVCVPAAEPASRVVVPARTGPDDVGLFLVDPRSRGVRLERQRVTNRLPHHRLGLESVRVGPDDVLGDPRAGRLAVEWLVERATTACCAVQLGVSERALRMTAEYTASRVQFERPIGSFQAVHVRAADAYIQLQAMRLTTWDAACRLDQESPAAEQVAVAKYWAAEGGQFVGFAAQHLHGGIGIDVDYPLHRYYLWAKQLELTLGSAPAQLARLGSWLADPPGPSDS
jgi:alkylation response protein AidB-like acyl-CoA dehydrogenase